MMKLNKRMVGFVTYVAIVGAHAQSADLAPPEFPVERATALPTLGSIIGRNDALISQNSENKIAQIIQSGTGNWASILQTGSSADQAYINQSGSNNRALIVQR